MDLSIIIINYNTFELTCQCIKSVFQQTKDVSFEIILVDNASTKDNPDDFLKLFPSIKLVKNPENNGFAKGNNLGITYAQSKLILLLNSDTYFLEDAISKTVKYYHTLNNPGVLTINMVYENGKYQKSARKFRGLCNEILDSFRPILFLLPYKKRARLMLNQYFNGDFNTTCDWCSGAFFMFAKDRLLKMPNQQLDDRYFMYGEDELWCYQMKQLGYINYYFSTAKVVHILNASSSREKQQKLLDLTIQRTIDSYNSRTNNQFKKYLFATIVNFKLKIHRFFNS